MNYISIIGGNIQSYVNKGNYSKFILTHNLLQKYQPECQVFCEIGGVEGKSHIFPHDNYKLKTV